MAYIALDVCQACRTFGKKAGEYAVRSAQTDGAE